MSIISDSYSAVKYYKYDEYGKITTLGSSSFINEETYTGAISEGSNIQIVMRILSCFFANVNAQAHKPPQKAGIN